MVTNLRILVLAVLAVAIAVIGFLLGTSLYELDRSISANGLAALMPWFLREL